METLNTDTEITLVHSRGNLAIVSQLFQREEEGILKITCNQTFSKYATAREILGNRSYNTVEFSMQNF